MSEEGYEEAELGLTVPDGETPPDETLAGDEAHPDDETPPDGETPPEEEHDGRPVSRKEARVQKLANERAEALAEAKAAREQAEFYRKQAEQLQQHRTPPVEDQYIDPDEKWRRDTQAQINQSLFLSQDLADKAAYDRSAMKNPHRERLADKVEKHLQEARAKGQYPNREGVYLHLLGLEVDGKAGKTTPAARDAQRRVAAAKTTPTSARSNVPASRKEQSLDERMASYGPGDF